MTQPSISISVFFDFLCPYAYRTAMWLDQVRDKMVDRDFEINWRYFSLEQVNLPAGSDWKVWEQADEYEHPNPERNGPNQRGLFAFWAAEAARKQGPECFDRFRATLYNARHNPTENRPMNYSNRKLFEQVAAAANLDINRFIQDFHDRSLLEALRRDHEEAIARGIFGVPTIVFDNENAVFLKMDDVPPVEDVLPFFHNLRHSFTGRRWLLEAKRPGA
ncbi:MAG: thioredoxin domain-containing protein [Chloroflexaceae bacterium]|nr:thioredoxin domain-containing protein [Chloroflexaceae bacterium]NJO05431.1 thioredoxin domain-containing protein [Chloroflexaceae bacterium]